MKTIKEPKKNIELLWRSPQPTQARYRPMKYLLTTQVDDGLLLYNVVTSGMILLNESERALLERLPAEYCKEMGELIARHYFVTESFDEGKSVKQLRALLKKWEPPKRVSGFTILPTTDCNARCYYCFESDHKRCTMTEEIAERVIEYISEKCESEPIEIGWFGGEPLVGRRRISQICVGLRNKGIKFRSTMVSNAYLFDPNLIKIAKGEWNLISVQVTLDGTEEVYNTTKAYISPIDNPYKRVLTNIEDLLQNEIAVNVRLNVTDRNAKDLCDLVDLLADRFGGDKRFTCYSHAVYENVGFEPLSYDADIREYVDRQTVFLDNKLREKGLLGSLSRLPALRVIRCMADYDSSRLIYPDGTVGKCENKPSSEGVGDIYFDITDNDMNLQYKAIEEISGCNDCSFFPNCINLKICPETGQCSEARVEWMKKRYASLMQDRYLRYKKDAAEATIKEDIQLECDS